MIVIHHGRAEDILPTIPAASVDSVVTDPPYPEIDRPYGRMTEAEWFAMMRVVVAECRRILKPSGSAVFILQANSERVGRMRPWLWDFMAWAAREHGIVQDAYWWNHCAPPTVHTHRTRGLMRPSVKACVWVGPEDCYRDQEAVLLPIAEATLTDKRIDRHELDRHPSGFTQRRGRVLQTCAERGGATPYNLLVCGNSDSANGAGINGHGAGTPYSVADWWIRYITPDNGTTCDPFAGSGTMLMAAKDQNLNAIGIEKESQYVETARRRVAATADRPLLSVSVPCPG